MSWPVFLLTLAAVELTPGPNMGWLAALAAREGRRAGFAAVLGIMCGLSIQVIAAATGLSALLAGWPVAYEALRWSGVGFMVFLALEAFRDDGSAPATRKSPDSGFWRGVVVNTLNPKALVFYLVVIGQFITPGGAPVWSQIMVLGAVHVAVATLVHGAIVIAADRASVPLERWRTSFAARLGFALLLCAIALWIALSTARPA